MVSETTRIAERYWRHTLAWTAVLLLAWALASFALPYWASALQFRFFGWPFSFWFVAQGAPLLFVLLIGIYAYVMDRLDRRHLVADDD